MRWQLRRKADPPPSPPPPLPDHEEARKALDKTDQVIEDTKGAGEEINAVTIKLIEYGRRNNFTAMVTKSLQPRRGS